MTVTPEQHVEIAIRCALRVCTETAWTRWARRWVSREDRSSAVAARAASAAMALSVAGRAAWKATVATMELAAAREVSAMMAANAAIAYAREADPTLDVEAITREVVEGKP